ILRSSPRNSSSKFFPWSPASSKPLCGAAATICTSSATTCPTIRLAMWTGKPRRAPGRSRCASSAAKMNASCGSCLTIPRPGCCRRACMSEPCGWPRHWDGTFTTKMSKSVSSRRDWSPPKTSSRSCDTWLWSSRRRQLRCSVVFVRVTITTSSLPPAPPPRCPPLWCPVPTSYAVASCQLPVLSETPDDPKVFLATGIRQLLLHFFLSLGRFSTYTPPRGRDTKRFCFLRRRRIRSCSPGAIFLRKPTGGANDDPRSAQESSHHIRRSSSDRAGSCPPDGGTPHRRRTGSRRGADGRYILRARPDEPCGGRRQGSRPHSRRPGYDRRSSDRHA